VLKRRRTTMSALDSCIRDIQSLLGYNRFLLSQTISEMQACIVDGIIVIINVTDIQSDVIIISLGTIKVMRLPKLLASKVRGWLEKKWTSRRSERPKRNQEYLKYLS
jgi:hypothetical protein